MAWQDEMITMLRYMIGDYTVATQVYSDENLEQIILLASKQVVAQLTFDQNYVATMSTGVLSPDPTTGSGKDDSFVNLVTLKAASILDRTEASLAAKRAIIVRDGSSMIDLSKVAASKLSLLAKGGWNAVYDDAALEYQYNRTQNIAGSAIMTPFRLYAQGSYTRTSYFGGDLRSDRGGYF